MIAIISPENRAPKRFAEKISMQRIDIHNSGPILERTVFGTTFSA